MKLTVIAALVIICFTNCRGPLHTMHPNIKNGGRAVALTRHPGNDNHVIVASETGGLFKSTNAGVNWNHTSGSTTFGYTDVLYYPPNANVILATAGDDSKTTTGGGIWRSTNGGATWVHTALTTPAADCGTSISAYGLSFEPGTNKIWAGTSCGLASSTDEGVTWNFVPASANYNNDKVFAVLSPAANQLKILTDAGVKVSTDGGTSWSISTTGLPGYINKGIHNQIACSPRNHQHIFWAFNSYSFTESQWHISLYMSTNNGASWTAVIDNPGINRAPFVRTADSRTGTSSQFDIYFGDGGCRFTRATFNGGTTPTISGAWSDMAHDHCDGADVVFKMDGKTPLVYASDGGIHTTANSGGNWTMNGGGSLGYNALQITEVTGQKHATGGLSDLYFGTQDNDIWASPDGGGTWPHQMCCEGFYLNVPRQALAASNTKFTTVACGPCGNFISGPLLSGLSGFSNPPNDAGNPRLLSPGNYVHNTALPGLSASIFNFTNNNGSAWAPKYAFPEELRDLSKTSGAGPETSIFVAVRKPGTTADGNEILGIKKITGVLDAGTPIVSDVTGFGSLGIFPTMFAWYKPFGVDVHDANHLIVPDITEELVKVSRDGGVTWTPDIILTNLVTQGGVFKFRKGAFTQISNISFDPDNAGHILVGTIQAGIFRSCDNGASWSKIANSELVPFVSSFYFSGNYKAIASSYGRGLWNMDLEACRPRIRLPRDEFQIEFPLIYYMGAWIPIKDLGNPDVCPKCAFFFVRGGEIRTYSTAANTTEVNMVTLSGGEITGMDAKGNTVQLPFKIETNAGAASTFGSDDKLAQMFRRQYQVKGIYLEGNIFKGLILAKKDLSKDDLPRQQPQRPALRVEVVYAGGVKGGPKGIRIFGSGFDKNLPLEILIDGRPVQTQVKERYDDRGFFTLEIDHPLSVGGHTLQVVQKTANGGVVREAYTFNVTTQDERKEK